MSRVERLMNKKKNKRTIYYPITLGVIFVLLLLLLVDYRINNVMGLKKIRIVDVSVNDNLVEIGTLGYDIGHLDLSYLKDDMNKMKSNVLILARGMQDSIESRVKDVMKQY